MKTFQKKFWAVIILMVMTTHCLAQKINWMDYKTVNMQQVINQAQKENKYIFVDIWTTWCGVCKAIDKYIFTRQDVADFFNQNTVNITFDAEYGAWREVAQKYGATYYPTILILNPKGEIVLSIDGIGVPTPQQHDAKKSEVAERMMEQARMAFRLEKMTDEELTDSTFFAFMKNYGVGFDTQLFQRLIDNKETMQKKYGVAFVRLCKTALNNAASNMLTYGAEKTHIVNEYKLKKYEEVVKRLDFPYTPSLLLSPKLDIATGLGKWKEALDLTENNFSLMTPYMLADVIGEFTDGCHDKALMNRAAQIFKKSKTMKANDRERQVLDEVYGHFLQIF